MFSYLLKFERRCSVFSSRQWHGFLSCRSPRSLVAVLWTRSRNSSPRLGRNLSLLPLPICVTMKRRQDWTTLWPFITEPQQKEAKSKKALKNNFYFIGIFQRSARWGITLYNTKQSVLNLTFHQSISHLPKQLSL